MEAFILIQRWNRRAWEEEDFSTNCMSVCRRKPFKTKKARRDLLRAISAGRPVPGTRSKGKEHAGD
jgi:hypothetical protein